MEAADLIRSGSNPGRHPPISVYRDRNRECASRPGPTCDGSPGQKGRASASGRRREL